MSEKRRKISEIVQRDDWQRVRKNLLGRWKTEPLDCCRELKLWLGPVSKASNDELRIMMNYLTGSAFRMGKIKHPCIQNIRNIVSQEINHRKTKNVWYSN